jgi:hypothetical protein
MTVHHQERGLSTQVGIVICLVLPAVLALWLLWSWLGYSPTGGLGFLHHLAL